MNLNEQKQAFDEFIENQRRIMLGKGDDYANQDRLSNFKLVADICGLTTQQVTMVFLATKVVRLGNLIGNKIPKNESIDDSELDLCNYAILQNMLRNEKPEQQEPGFGDMLID